MHTPFSLIHKACLRLVLKCVLVIGAQADSRDTSPFTPVSIMRLQGLQISLLPTSLPREGQRAGRTVNVRQATDLFHTD